MSGMDIGYHTITILAIDQNGNKFDFDLSFQVKSQAQFAVILENFLDESNEQSFDIMEFIETIKDEEYLSAEIHSISNLGLVTV